MKFNKLKILLLEDSYSDVMLIERELKKEFKDYTLKWVEKKEQYMNELIENDYDVFLCDYSLPSYDGFSALKYAQKKCPKVPFIIVTGSLDEETAVDLIKAGAWDYVLKENLIRLVAAIKSSIKLKKEIRKKDIAEQSLIINETKLKRIFESYQDVYYETDIEGNLLEVSPSCFELFGYTRKELLGSNVENLYANKNDRSVFMHKIKEKRALYDYEILLTDSNGTVIPCAVSAKLTTIDNETLSIIGSMRNITDRKNSEQELIKAKNRAEESDKMKSVFLSIMSHEFRTPLNAIIGFSEVISKETNIDDILSFNSLINKSGCSLLTIVDELFHVASIYSDELRLEQNKFYLRDVFNEVYKSTKKGLIASGKSNVNLIVKHCELCIGHYVTTDKILLKRSLMILLNNAVKFTETGLIEFGYEMQNDNRYLFFVKDTGVGIPVEKYSMIFENFRLGDESHSRRHGGIGLGLHIVKKVVELLGGEIFFKSKVNKGTEFYFYLKLSSVKGEKIKLLNKPLRNVNWKNTNLLVVDDHESSIALIRIILRKSGIVIHEAVNGDEAVKFCDKNPNIDIVLMDIKMPYLDGYKATKIIKKKHKNIKIIATTAYALSGDKEMAIEAGCNDYVTKPLNATQLITVLGKYIDTKKL